MISSRGFKGVDVWKLMCHSCDVIDWASITTTQPCRVSNTDLQVIRLVMKSLTERELMINLNIENMQSVTPYLDKNIKKYQYYKQ